MRQGNLKKFIEKEEVKRSYKLPSGWRWVRLGEVCEVEKGKTPNEFHYAERGVRIIKNIAILRTIER